MSHLLRRTQDFYAQHQLTAIARMTLTDDTGVYVLHGRLWINRDQARIDTWRSDQGPSSGLIANLMIDGDRFAEVNHKHRQVRTGNVSSLALGAYTVLAQLRTIDNARESCQKELNAHVACKINNPYHSHTLTIRIRSDNGHVDSISAVDKDAKFDLLLTETASSNLPASLFSVNVNLRALPGYLVIPP